jgi:hypothetical protein
MLDRQIATIARAFERVDRERMRCELDVFVAALHHDLIDATDFAAGERLRIPHATSEGHYGRAGRAAAGPLMEPTKGSFP